MLRKILPIAMRHKISIGMFGDDLTAWTTGLKLPRLENKLTQLISIISHWNRSHNMDFSEKVGKCKTILFTNNRNDQAHKVQLNDKVLLAVKQTKLLGVILIDN